MAKKPGKWKKTLRARRISKALKKFHAKARLIQEKEPSLTYREAAARVKESFIGTVRRIDEKFLQRWFTMDREHDIYKRLLPGKPAKRIFTYGPDMGLQDVLRSRGVMVYWGLIHRMSDMLGLSIEKTRSLFRDMKEAMKAAARSVGKKRTFRTRDVAAVIEFSDRYPKVRQAYGI